MSLFTKGSDSKAKRKKYDKKKSLKEENKNFIHDCTNISTRKAIDIKYLKLSVCST